MRNCIVPDRRVLVLNHFAVPRDRPGGTRHIELFGRLAGWSSLILASRLNLTTGEAQESSAGFKPVAVTPYSGNGARRILNWISYAVSATGAGLTARRPDVVYASSPHLLAGLAGWAIARLRRAVFVLEVRDLWPQVLIDMGQLSPGSALHRLLTGLETFLYRQAAAVIIMAPDTRGHVRARGVDDDRIFYIPNGSDSADFVPSRPREELRQRYGFDRLTAVYAGAHGPANGLDLLLDAAARSSDVDVDVVLVGSGVEKDRLVARAEDERLSHVRFLPPVPKDEIPDLLAAADIGLHVLADVELFRYGVSPNKVFDYFAAGLPVLTNSPGIVGDLVESSGAGMVTEPDGLARGLAGIARLSPADLRERGTSGQAWLNVNQSRSAMVVKLGGVLHSLVPDAATSRGWGPA